MKVKRYEQADLRLVLAAMVVDDASLGHIAPNWGAIGLFDHSWANMIGSWCVEWHQKYHTAPGTNIDEIFMQWAASPKANADTTGMVEAFLNYVDDDFNQRPEGDRCSQYLMDRCGEYFESVSLKKLHADFGDLLDAGAAKEAKAVLEKYAVPNIGKGAYVDITDQSAMQAAFDEKTEGLITWDGPIGQFFAQEFCRDSFIAFMGPEKRGKTWWLIEVVWQAMLQRRRVAFFQVGDMSQNQTFRRLASRMAKAPRRAKTIKYPKQLYPEGEVELAEKVFENDLDWGRAWKSLQRVMKNTMRTDESFLRIGTYPNSSITAAGVGGVLYDWQRQGWKADVVVIDYADILAAPAGYSESRDGVNANWKMMRRISQELHACVVTATQADAQSYGREVIGRDNFSEDKRKLAHVTGMIGLNQTEDEKDFGVMRLNWLARREEFYQESKCLTVAGCLDIGRPVMLSAWH